MKVCSRQSSARTLALWMPIWAAVSSSSGSGGRGRGAQEATRTAIAFRQLDRAVFLHAFAKSERDNIDRHDLARLKKLSAIYLAASNAELESWCLRGELKKVT